jgi:D-alanyl-D-alanine carboxypeptidase
MKTPFLRRESAHREPAGGLSARRPGVIQSPRAAAALATVVALMVLSMAGWASASTGGVRPGAGAGLRSALRRDLSQYLASRRRAEHFSAISLQVTFPRSPTISVAVGATRYRNGQPLSTRALWQVGSNTKAFTSVMILQLEAEGKLSIGDRLGKWLPQYPKWKNITIRQLLNMTSRIPDYPVQPAFESEFAANPHAVFSARQLVSFAYGLPLLPKGWHYSNTNYILAQMIIEKAGRNSYPGQLLRRIVIPLRLRTLCDAPYTCPFRDAARMPDGYLVGNPPPMARLNGTPAPKLGLTAAQGAGGIVSSMADMTTWLRALYQGQELPPRQQRQLESLVSQNSGKPIARATPGNPGFGLGVAQFASPATGTIWGYEGETFGYRFQHIYQPVSGVIIELAVNSGPPASDDQLGSLGVTVLKTLQASGVLTTH